MRGQSTATTLDQRVTLLKRLKSEREKIDSEITTLQKELEGELASLIGLVQPRRAGDPKAKGLRKCSVCGRSGHNAATCEKRASASGKTTGSEKKARPPK